MMRSIETKYQVLSFFACSLILAYTGCGAPVEPIVIEQVSQSQEQPQLGPLTKNILEIQSSEYVEDCDKKQTDIMQEVAKALEHRNEELHSVAKTLPVSTEFRNVPLAKTFARELVSPIIPTQTWYTYDKSWSRIYKQYLNIKDTPTDQEWLTLNSRVQSIISDDQDRVLYRENNYLDKDSGRMIEHLVAMVFICLNNQSCFLPAFQSHVEDFVRKNPYYNGYWQQILTEKTNNKKRDSIKQLLDRLQWDFEYYRFQTNDAVIRKSPGELILPLDGTAFAGAEDQIAGYIENVWKSKSLRLKVQWVKSNELPNVFKLLLGETLDARPSTNYYHRAVRLFPGVETKAIAHEIGHVLGFKDHYYPVWHPESCKYVIQINESDIMSDLTVGGVTESEWATLDQKYPARLR